MNLNLLPRLFAKIMNGQLRKPSGLLAKCVGKMMNRINEALYDLTIETMQLRENDSILEIGFGNGKFFEKIFSQAKNLKISGIELSQEMVEAAKRNNPSTTKSGKLDLHFGNSDKLPFPDNSFDKVVCINVIYFWEQPEKHLKEVHRVLKTNGKFFATVRTKENMSHLSAAEYGFILYSKDEWKAILEKNNFKFLEATNEKVLQDKQTKEPHEFKFICLTAEKQ